MTAENATVQAHPTIGETAVRLWTRLPSLYKVLIPALVGLIGVLVPASVLINSRLDATATDNLRTQHQALLAQVGGAFDDLFSGESAYLTGFASSAAVKQCAADGCQAAAPDLFANTLSDRLHEPNTYDIEVGFLNTDGQETARAIRGNGTQISVPGTTALFTADPAALSKIGPGETYLYPITRDARLAPTDPYQAPTLRFAMPVQDATNRLGYVTAVVKLDDFFARYFVYSDQYQIFLLDTQKCLLTTADNTRRAEVYRTWTNDSARTCYPNLTLPDWDVNVEKYLDTILSTRVLHGPLTNSGQTWTIVVQQIAALAYAQTNRLQILLTGAHLFTILFVTVLIIGADRASQHLLQADQVRLAAHARDTHFNPYVVGTPIDEPRRFFGRTQAMAQVIGMSVMAGNDIIIDGDRQIGKSSLLRQIERRLRDQQIPDPLYRYWPVALSLQDVAPETLYFVLMEHILRDVANHETRADLQFHAALYRQQPAAYGLAQFREDISQVLALPDSDGKQPRLVLCLDNIPFGVGDDSQAFQSLFRDLGTQVLLIGTATHLPPTTFDSIVALFHLGPLEPSEAARLIREPVAQYYPFADEAVTYLLDHSDGLPGEVQRLAWLTVQSMLEQDAPAITLAHAQRAVERAISDSEKVYRRLWNGGADKSGQISAAFNQQQRSILLKAAATDGVIDPAYIVLAQDGSAAFTRLELEDIAYTDLRGNVVLRTLFKRWLSREKRLGIG